MVNVISFYPYVFCILLCRTFSDTTYSLFFLFVFDKKKLKSFLIIKFVKHENNLLSAQIKIQTNKKQTYVKLPFHYCFYLKNFQLTNNFAWLIWKALIVVQYDQSIVFKPTRQPANQRSMVVLQQPIHLGCWANPPTSDVATSKFHKFKCKKKLQILSKVIFTIRAGAQIILYVF